MSISHNILGPDTFKAFIFGILLTTVDMKLAAVFELFTLFLVWNMLCFYLRRRTSALKIIAAHLTHIYVTVLIAKRLGYLESIAEFGEWMMDIMFGDIPVWEVGMNRPRLVRADTTKDNIVSLVTATTTQFHRVFEGPRSFLQAWLGIFELLNLQQKWLARQTWLSRLGVVDLVVRSQQARNWFVIVTIMALTGSLCLGVVLFKWLLKLSQLVMWMVRRLEAIVEAWAALGSRASTAGDGESAEFGGWQSA